MNILNVKVRNRNLRINEKDIVGNNVGFDQVKFDFSEEWEKLEKVAVFYLNEDELYPVLVTDNVADIPYQVLKNNQVLYFGLYGVSNNQKILSSKILKIEIAAGCPIKTAEDYEEYEDIHVQILAKLADIYDRIRYRNKTEEEIETNWEQGAYQAGIYVETIPAYTARDIPVKGKLVFTGCPEGWYHTDYQVYVRLDEIHDIILQNADLDKEIEISDKYNNISITVGTEDLELVNQFKFKWNIYTEETIKERIDKKADAISLNNYVPKTRKVADVGLNQDITGVDIVDCIQKLGQFAYAVYNAMIANTNNYYSNTKVLEAINKNFYSIFEVDSKLKEKVDKTLSIAGLSLDNDIGALDLINALNLFNNFVPMERRVAGLELSENIGASDLAIALRLEELYATKEALSIVESIAKGATQAKSFQNYSLLIDDLKKDNDVKSLKYRIGQNFFIGTSNVPDVWVYYSYLSYGDYEYSTDEQFVSDLINESAGVHVGFYYLKPLETSKVDLSGYVPTTRKILNSDLSKDLTVNDFFELAVNSNFYKPLLASGYSQIIGYAEQSEKLAKKENWQLLGSQDFASGEQLNLTVDFEGVKYKKLWIVIAYTSFSATSQPIHLIVGGEYRSFTYTHTSKWMYRFLLEDKIEANEVNRKSNITMERSLGAANVYGLQQGLPLIEDLTEIRIFTPSTVTFTSDTTVYVYGLEAE